MIKEIFSRLRAFRWQKLLLIWAVFAAMAAILFAERSGIQYEAAKFKLNGFAFGNELVAVRAPDFRQFSLVHIR